MILKTGMELAQDYTVFNCGHPRPHKYLKSQGITIMAQPGINPAPNFFFPRHIKEETGKAPPPPDSLIVDNLETLLATTVDKASGNTSGAIVERFIKTIASTIFGQPVYSLDGPGP